MKRPTFLWFCIFLIACCSFAGDICADSLFKNRRINLSDDDNHVFRVGVTGTTSGLNYIALIENAKQESISLSDLGYWEMVPDPPSFLRNFELQLIIRNNYQGNFQIEFEYDKQRQDIDYRIMEGAIKVKIDNSEYYPIMIIDHEVLEAKSSDDVIQSGSKRFMFFDFNSNDAVLRKYYGSIKSLLNNPEYSHNFYYYESCNYNSFYFKLYQSFGNLDADKMGLSLENDTMGYYQKVLDNLQSRLGNDFADQIIIVSRFGNNFSKDLKKYAHEIGMSRDMEVTFWSYDDTVNTEISNGPEMKQE